MTIRDDRRTGFGTDARGAIAVMTALLLPVLIGIAAYAVDASLLLYRQERLQIAADIGARAGAEMLVRGESDARAIAFAETMVAANVGANAGAEPAVTVALPAPGQLLVDASLPVARVFSQIFGTGAVSVHAGSVAIYEMAAAPAFCIYLDDPGANRALRLRQRSSLTMEGCALGIASDHGRAVTLDADAVLRADCLDVAGDVSGADQITLSICAAPRTGVAVPLPDDFARLRDAPPGPSGACTDVDSGGKGKAKGKDKDGDDDGAPDTLVPAALHPSGLREMRLCDGLEIGRDTVGGPGIYFFEEDLEIADGVTLDLGPGAVVVLQDDAEIKIGTDALLRIAPPASGALQGVGIMAGRDRSDGERVDLDIGRLDMPGILAFPGEKITLEGTNADAGCLRIYAGELELARGTRIATRCTGLGGGGGGGGSVTLVRSAP